MSRRRKSGENREQSQRQLRVGESLRRALTEILQKGDMHDTKLAMTPITVSEVNVSPDLRNATAFVLPLGGRDIPDILDRLAAAAPYLQGRMGRMTGLKYTPKLRFEADRTFDRADEIDALLRSPRVARDVDPAPHDSSSPSSGKR